MHPRPLFKSIRPTWSKQPVITELKATPLPEAWLPLLKDKRINHLYQVGNKTCLLGHDTLIVLDANSKVSPTEHKIPVCNSALPWSDEVIILNCDDQVISFNLTTLSFSEIHPKFERLRVVGKMKSGSDDILIMDIRSHYLFFKANDLSKLEHITSEADFEDAYDGVVSEDLSNFMMKTRSDAECIASFKDGRLIRTDITAPRLEEASICAARKNGYVYGEFKFGDGLKFKLLDDKLKVTASTDTNIPGLDRMIVLPDQQNFLCVSLNKDFITVVKFKQKAKPKAKDELETTVFKLPGEIVCPPTIDEDNARLITFLKNKEGIYNLYLFDDFQPLLEHREKLRKQFDSTRSGVTLSLFGNRQRNVPMAIVDIITDYALNPRR